MKNLTKLSLVAIAIMVITHGAHSQEGSDESTYNIAEGHSKVWKEAIAQIIELSDAMPEDQYKFQPHDSVRTFAEQLVHIGGSSLVIANLYLKDIPPPEEQPDMNVAEMSKAEIVEFVKSMLKQTGAIIASMSDQQLMEGIKSFRGNDMTRLEGLLTVHDHLTNHKAKANLYVRISNNQPPSYRYY